MFKTGTWESGRTYSEIPYSLQDKFRSQRGWLHYYGFLMALICKSSDSEGKLLTTLETLKNDSGKSRPEIYRMLQVLEIMGLVSTGTSSNLDADTLDLNINNKCRMTLKKAMEERRKRRRRF